MTAFDDQLRQLLADMVDTMYAAHGTGIAAPQVGVTIRACIVDARTMEEAEEGKSRIIKMVNPEIISRSGEIYFEEGCLSIPEFYQEIKRSSDVTVRYQDETGKSHELHVIDLPAVVCQHEIDHLNGKLIIDSISRLKQKLYIEKMKKRDKMQREHQL